MARPSGDFCLEDTRHKPSRLRIDPGTSASTENLTSNHVDTNAVPIVTRSSLSTPPPSTQHLVNARATKSFDPNKNEHRRSWYKPFVKRDKKGKTKDTSFADLQSSISAEAAAAAASSPSSSIDTGSSMLRDGSHSSAGSHDIRYLMTISHTESSTPSIGNSEGRASATNNTDPDSHASSSSAASPSPSDNRKRSSLHPASLIKGRLIPSSIRASSVDSSTTTTSSKQKHFRGKPFPLPRRRHSFDSMHSCNNEDSRAKRRRRRSSADPLVVSSRSNNNNNHPSTTSPTEENWEVEKRQQPVVHFDNDLVQRSANNSIHSRSPDVSLYYITSMVICILMCHVLVFTGAGHSIII